MRPSTSAPSSSGGHSRLMSAQSVRWLMACRKGIRSKPSSFAPTQREPATCGTQVKGLLMKTVAMSTGRFSRKKTPSKAHATRWTGSGVGGMKAINRPRAKRTGHAGAIESPAAAVEHDHREVLQTPVLLQRLRSGVTRLEPAFHGFYFTPPKCPLCRFRDACTRLCERLGNQWLVAGGKSTV